MKASSTDARTQPLRLVPVMSSVSMRWAPRKTSRSVRKNALGLHFRITRSARLRRKFRDDLGPPAPLDLNAALAVIPLLQAPQSGGGVVSGDETDGVK